MIRRQAIESSGSRVIQCDAKLRYLGAHIRRYVHDFGLRHFVETGTGIGESAAYVQGIQPPFSTIWSCDVEQLQIERALGVYPQLGSDPRVHLSWSTSAQFLSTLLPLIPAAEPILIWSDAHLPGTYYGRKKFSDEKDPDVRMPLEHELALIQKHRPKGRDVILIDDLWFWLPGEFEWGRLPDELREYCPQDGIAFIDRMFGNTHTIEVHRDFSGWLSLTPA